MAYLAYILVVIVYGSSNYYIGKHVFRWLQFIFPQVSGIFFACIFGGFAITTFLGLLFSFVDLKINATLANMIGSIGEHWMGIFFYSLLLFLLSDIVLFFLHKVHYVVDPLPPRIVLIRGTIVIMSVLCLFTYGRIHADRIVLKDYYVQIDKVSSLKALKIVLISDLHLGYINDAQRAEHIVQKINALQPDVVCIAGDIFNGEYASLLEPQQVVKSLRRIKSTYGVFASLGNHDAGKSYDAMVTFLEEGNVQLLEDEVQVIQDKFVLVGRKDSSPIGNQGVKRIDTNEMMKKVDTTLPVIVMDHQPANMADYGEGVDIILSGHTHKGQIFPANLITQALYTVDYGYYRKQTTNTQVIVTSGVGTWGPPLRIGSDNEIVAIDINFGVSNQG